MLTLEIWGCTCSSWAVFTGVTADRNGWLKNYFWNMVDISGHNICSIHSRKTNDPSTQSYGVPSSDEYREHCICIYSKGYLHHEYVMVILKGVVFREKGFLWDKSSPHWTQSTSDSYILCFRKSKGVHNKKSSVNNEYIRMLLVFWGNLWKVPQGVQWTAEKNDRVGWTYLVINSVILTVE